MKNEDMDGGYISILIYRDITGTANGFGNQIRVLVPEGYSLNIFRRFVYSGCKPIGLKEYKSIMLEQLIPIYPDDYLNCHGGEKEQLDKTTDKI